MNICLVCSYPSAHDPSVWQFKLLLDDGSWQIHEQKTPVRRGSSHFRAVQGGDLTAVPVSDLALAKYCESEWPIFALTEELTKMEAEAA